MCRSLWALALFSEPQQMYPLDRQEKKGSLIYG